MNQHTRQKPKTAHALFLLLLLIVMAIGAVYTVPAYKNGLRAQSNATATLSSDATTTATLVIYGTSGPQMPWDIYPTVTSGPTMTNDPTLAAKTPPPGPTP